MAITKTTLFTTTGTNARTFANLYDFIRTSCVPGYFDAVTMAEDESSFVCSVGGEVSAAFFPAGTSSSSVCTFYLASGADLAIKTNTTGAAYYYGTGYVCEHGVSISVRGSSASSEKPPALTICKDSGGKTVIIATSNMNVGSNTAIAAVNAESAAPDLANDYNAVKILPNTGNFNRTVLCPIIIPDDAGSTVEGVFLTPYTQYKSNGILLIDGVRYLSNGYWAVKDV